MAEEADDALADAEVVGADDELAEMAVGGIFEPDPEEAATV
jgi:hypothetical protein